MGFGPHTPGGHVVHVPSGQLPPHPASRQNDPVKHPQSMPSNPLLTAQICPPGHTPAPVMLQTLAHVSLDAYAMQSEASMPRPGSIARSG